MTTETIQTVDLPAFGKLPLRKGDPAYSAWGLWGEDDHLGTLVSYGFHMTSSYANLGLTESSFARRCETSNHRSPRRPALQSQVSFAMHWPTVSLINILTFFHNSWSLTHPKTPGFGRHEHAFDHSIIGPDHVLDDMVRAKYHSRLELRQTNLVFSLPSTLKRAPNGMGCVTLPTKRRSYSTTELPESKS